MNREIFKIVIWYKPNKDDARVCKMCAEGWAFYCSDASGLYLHKPNNMTDLTVCRAVNKTIPKYMRSKVAEAA